MKGTVQLSGHFPLLSAKGKLPEVT